MIISSKTIEWKEKIPRVNVRMGCKMAACPCETPCRDATALETVPLQLALTLFPRKKQYDLGTSYTHKKRKQYKHG